MAWPNKAKKLADVRRMGYSILANYVLANYVLAINRKVRSQLQKSFVAFTRDKFSFCERVGG